MDSFEELERHLKKDAVIAGYGTGGILFGLSAYNNMLYYLDNSGIYIGKAVDALQEVVKNYWLSAGAVSAVSVVVIPALVGAAAYKIIYKLNIGDKKFLKSLFE